MMNQERIKYTDEQLNKHFNEKNNDWDNWCNDVALFYAYRHVLFPTKPIPIARLLILHLIVKNNGFIVFNFHRLVYKN